MKTPLIVDLFDFYGKDIPLQIFGAAKKKSIFGAIMGLLSLLAVGAITIYFLITLFSRETKQIIINQSYSKTPSTDLNNLPIMLNFADALGRFIPPEAGIWDASTNLYEMIWSNGTSTGILNNIIKLRKCTREDAAGYPIPDSFLSSALCVPFGKNNITLKNYFNSANGWSSFYLHLSKCNPKTNSKCQNSSVIEQTMEKGYFSIYTFASSVDNDALDPAKPFFSMSSLSTSNSLYKGMDVFLTQNLYTDDVGFVFESLVDHNFFVMGEVKYDYSLSPPSGWAEILGDSTIVATINLQNTKSVTITKRTFLKAQVVLANIGGVFKFIMVIAQVITQFVSRRNVFIQIGNEVFDYATKKVKNLEKKKKNENPVIEIDEKTQNVVSLSEREKEAIQVRKRNANARRPSKLKTRDEKRERLSLNLWELICLPCCVGNKHKLNQYNITERTILEKVSIHSLIRDSYKLEKLSALTLNDEQHTKLCEKTHKLIRELM